MERPAPRPFSEVPELTDLPPASAFRDDRLRSLHALAHERAPVGKISGLAGSVVLIGSPDTVHEVLVEKARLFEKSPVLRMALFPLAGVGLFTSEGDLWKRQRKLMSPIFQVSQIKRFAAQMSECAEQAAAAWRDGETLDIAHETTRIAMAVAGKTLFGIDTFGETDELGEALTTTLHWTGETALSMRMIAQARLRTAVMLAADRSPDRIAAPLNALADMMLKPLLLPDRETRAMKRALEVLDRRVSRMIAERRASPAERNDLLSRLLNARDEDDGATMSDRQVRDEVLTLFVAGHETTATGLAWAIMLLCQHPEAYARARDEALALPGVPGYEDLPRLPYCLRVFKESLRMYPPVFMFGRQTTTEVEIGGYLLPKGTICISSPFAMHHRSDLWPDPERFDPDRFTPEAESARPRSAYFPFSLGPRTCIGNHFALMEGPLVLASLLRRADFELIDPRGTKADPSATLRPKDGIPVRVKLRAKGEAHRAHIDPNAALAS
ncbi:MAG: cytochrome P450 [Polyangiaceae bacterium]